jgi:hypothetical protein
LLSILLLALAGEGVAELPRGAGRAVDDDLWLAGIVGKVDETSNPADRVSFNVGLLPALLGAHTRSVRP